jgi:AmmeMemoRadiSam system protein B
MSEEPLPAVRPLEMVPTQHEGNPVVLMRDAEGISENVLVLPIPAFYVISCLNGQTKASDIQGAFEKQFGQPLRDEDLQAILDQLDSNHMLLTERYEEMRRLAEKEYDDLPARLPRHAGQAYPDAPEALKATFDAFFTLDGGPGAIADEDRGNGLPAQLRRPDMAGLVLPHIDPRCGGPCASWALKALAGAKCPDVFVIFGTSHTPLPNAFSVDDKPFDTPLGAIPCDTEFIERLRESYGAERLDGGKLAQRNEHSIEFQAVFLHALYGDPPPFTIVPILCGSFNEMIESGESPESNAEITEFCQAVRQAAEASGKRVCYVAGADLAHMGRKFGDEEGLSDELIQSTREKDLAMLEYVERLDREAFFQNLQAEGDARKVCGLPPMYAMLACMNAREGKLLKYDYNLEPATQSLVSFCAMAFYA